MAAPRDPNVVDVPKGEGPNPRKKLLIALGMLAAFGCCMWVGFHIGPVKGKRAPSKPEFDGREEANPPQAELEVPSSVELALPPPSFEDGLGLDAFLEQARQPNGHPLAKMIADAIKNDPRVQEAYRQYRQQSGGSAPVEGFLEKIVPMPSIRELLREMSLTPGFDVKVLSLPEKTRAITEAMRRAGLLAGQGPSAVFWRRMEAAVGKRGGRSPAALKANAAGAKVTRKKLLMPI